MKSFKEKVKEFESKNHAEIRTLILQDRFISEIEGLMRAKKLSKKKLAQHLNVSPSHITQIFQGKKLLNLKTLASVQDFFEIEFQVRALSEREIESHGHHFPLSVAGLNIITRKSKGNVPEAPNYDYAPPPTTESDTQIEQVA